MWSMECSVDDCADPRYCKGYCRIHYVRWRRHGDPLQVAKRGPKPRQCDCNIPDCGAPSVGQGLCRKHYMRLKRHGDPLATSRIVGDDEARWWSHVDRRGDDECWPWTAYCDENGYGIFSQDGSIVRAHRWGYERFVAPVADGLVPDHTCHDPAVCRLGVECPHRRCVNYRHLEPVTNRENSLRGAATKLSDEEVASLYATWKDGIGLDTIAAYAEVDKSALHRRFQRLEASITRG